MKFSRAGKSSDYATRVFSVLLAFLMLVSMVTVGGMIGLKVRAAQEDCTVKLDPMYMLTDCSVADVRIKRQVYYFDDAYVMAYQNNAAENVLFTFRLPYAVDEFKMTGVECVEDKYEKWRFHGFEVSADGQTWEEINVEKSDYTYVATHETAADCTISGLTFHGSAQTAFRYIRVAMGKDWIPGISWFYIPESDDATPNKVDPAATLVASSVPAGYSAKRQGDLNVGGPTPGESVRAFVLNGVPGMNYPLEFKLPYAVKEMDMTAISYVIPDTGKEFENAAGNYAFRGYEVSADGKTWIDAQVVKGPYVFSQTFNNNADIGANLYHFSSDESFQYIRLTFSHGWMPGIGHFYLPSNDVRVKKVEVDGPSAAVAGSKATFSAVISPESASVTSVNWSVEGDSAIAATIDAEGVFTAYNPGTYTITATAQDGSGVSGKKTVTVTRNPAPDACTVKVDPSGNSCYLGASVEGATVRREGTYTYDGVGGWEYTGIDISQLDAYMTFKLPYSVDKLKMTAIELAETSSYFERYHFQKFQVSADGENWTEFTVQRFDREFATSTKEHPEADRRVGVVLYGEAAAEFQYIRVYYPRDWLPGLCNFYLPSNKIQTEKLEVNGPAEVVAGSKTTFTTVSYPAEAAAAGVVWSVESDPVFATAIDQNGTLTAYNPGTYTIKATALDGSEVVGSKTVVVKANTEQDNCTVQFDPNDKKALIENTMDGSTVGRDNTYKHDGIGILVYKTPVYDTDNACLTFKLPYAVDQLKMTGVEFSEAYSRFVEFSFKSFWVSADGENWEPFEMQRMDRVDVSRETDEVLRIGVTLYGKAENKFQYFKVRMGKNWLPGISYFYLPETEIRLNTTELTAYTKGVVETLEATVMPSLGTGVRWTSSDESVVKVNGNGKLECVAPGVATVTATTKNGGYHASCEVTVVDGYGPKGCTYVLSPYCYVNNSASVTPKKGGTTYGVDGYPMVYWWPSDGTIMEEEPVLIYKLPYAVNELKITGVEDAGTRAVHAFEGFWVSKDGETWTEFDMSRDYVTAGWSGVTLYGAAQEEFQYLKVKWTTNGAWVPGITYLHLPPSVEELPQETYGAKISGGNTLEQNADEAGASFEADEESGVWRFKSDANSFAPGTVTYYFPYAITAYRFNVLDTFIEGQEGGYTYWASSDGVNYTQLDTYTLYTRLVSDEWRAFEISNYGSLKAEDDIRYLQIRMTGTNTENIPGIYSVELNAVDYPEREPLPDFRMPNEAENEQELLDEFNGSALSEDEGGKAYEAFQMEIAEYDTNGRGLMTNVAIRNAGYSDSYLVYKLEGDVTHIDVRGFRKTTCEETPIIWVSADGEDWEFIDDFEWIENTYLSGDPEFTMSVDNLPEGTRYVKVEIPILDDRNDLVLDTVQILYAGGERTYSPSTGVSDCILPVVLLAAAACAVILLSAYKRKETQNG